MNTDNRQPAAEGRMSLRDHLAELRTRMFKSVLGLTFGVIASSFMYKRVLSFLIEPYRLATKNPDVTLKVINPTDNVTVVIKLVTYLAIFVSSPVWLFQIWRFITPALHKKEKRYAIPFVISSILLFVFGGAIAMWTMPAALKFFEQIGGNEFESFYSPENYVRLVILIIIAFGVCFEFPVVLVALQLAGAVTSKTLLKGWRYAIVIVAFIAAVATPSQDPFSLMAMAIPMWIFYFGAIGIGKALKK
jgi:sec-independent protein translocase protein TatC